MTLAQDGAHPFQAYALFVSAWVQHLRRDVAATQPQAEAAIRLATEQELPYWAALTGLCGAGRWSYKEREQPA